MPDQVANFQFAVIDRMPAEELDRLPFGAIQLDHEGTILTYNARESEISGRSRESVLGRNFFTEVAPCTNVRHFAGRFRDGVTSGNLNAVFPYRFDFQMVPTDVTITLFYSEQTKTAWVFVVQA